MSSHSGYHWFRLSFHLTFSFQCGKEAIEKEIRFLPPKVKLTLDDEMEKDGRMLVKISKKVQLLQGQCILERGGQPKSRNRFLGVQIDGKRTSQRQSL